MSLLIPGVPNEFLWRLSSFTSRPSSAPGTAVTPVVGSKGSWTELIDGALVTNDVWAIKINVNNNSALATDKRTAIDVGIDPTAGTSYTTIIPDLMACSSGLYSIGGGGGGIDYLFPLHIPAGSSIAVRSQSAASTLSCQVFVVLYGKPRFPECTRKGSVVEAIGISGTAATAVTSGTTSEGSWTSLGTATREAWWWQMGVACHDATMATLTYSIDLSAGSAGGQFMCIEEYAVFVNTSEVISLRPLMEGSERTVPAGSTVYGRMQCSGTPDTDLGLCAYALS